MTTASRHGPWIAPELQNGWRSLGFCWRISHRGSLDFRGQVIPPEDPSQPLFQLNSIYRHFFGQSLLWDVGDEVQQMSIDDEGWIYLKAQKGNPKNDERGS